MPSSIREVPVADISYEKASQNATQYADTSVRWGGVIIDVENEEHFSLVQVLFYPLNRDGYPQLDKPPKGRFVIKSNRFLDPVVYAKGKKITVSGKLKGEIARTIGKKTIQVPLMASTAIYLWPVDYERNNWKGNGYGGFRYPFHYFGYSFYPRGYYSPFFY